MFGARSKSSRGTYKEGLLLLYILFLCAYKVMHLGRVASPSGEHHAGVGSLKSQVILPCKSSLTH